MPYRKIEVSTWNDRKFRKLSHDAKLVFFMLLTHPSMLSVGCFKASPPGLAAELDMEPEAFLKAFREALEQGMVEFDAEACLVVLPNFLKYNKPESPNVVRSWDKMLHLVPECDLRTRYFHRVG
jgi:hypothetical protein